MQASSGPDAVDMPGGCTHLFHVAFPNTRMSLLDMKNLLVAVLEPVCGGVTGWDEIAAGTCIPVS